MINEKIRKNSYLQFAGKILFVYGIVEIFQCITNILIAAEVISNFSLDVYEMLYPSEVASPWITNPILYLPFIFMMTSIRMMSGIGVLKNKLYGFWLGMTGSILTIIAILVVYSTSAFMLPFHALIIILLLMGYLKDFTIIN